MARLTKKNETNVKEWDAIDYGFIIGLIVMLGLLMFGLSLG